MSSNTAPDASTMDAELAAVDELSLDTSLMPPLPRRSGGTAAKRPTSSSSIVSNKKSKTTPNAPASKKTKDDIYNEPEKVLGNKKSPLYKSDANPVAIVQHPQAQGFFASSPNGYPLEGASSGDLSRASSEMKQEGLNGQHNEDWLMEALEASSRRARGDFDELVAEKFVETWEDENEEMSDSDKEQGEEEDPNGQELRGKEDNQDDDDHHKENDHPEGDGYQEDKIK